MIFETLIIRLWGFFLAALVLILYFWKKLKPHERRLAAGGMITLGAIFTLITVMLLFPMLTLFMIFISILWMIIGYGIRWLWEEIVKS